MMQPLSEHYRNLTPWMVWFRKMLLGREDLISNRSPLWLSPRSYVFKPVPKKYHLTKYHYYPKAPRQRVKLPALIYSYRSSKDTSRQFLCPPLPGSIIKITVLKDTPHEAPWGFQFLNPK